MATGALKKSSTGKLLLANDRSLMTCSCCGPSTTCDYVLIAYPCHWEFAEGTCRQILLQSVWVCADSTCNGTPLSEAVFPVVILVYNAELDDFRCYYTDPESYRPRAKIDEPSDYVDETTVWDCVESCDDELCIHGTYNCDCVCHNFSPDPDEWCCNGTKNEEGYLEWDWTYSSYFEKSVDWSTRRFIVGGCPTNVVTGCNFNQACTWYRTEQRHVNPEGYETDQNECCVTKDLEQRVALNRSGDFCDLPFVFPGCCYCPDIADNIWGGPIPTEMCGGSNLGFIYTTGYYYGPNTQDGCREEAFYNNSYFGSCDEVIEDYYDEIYGMWRDQCDARPDFCCFCEQHEVQYTHAQTDFIRPNANDVGCTQCFSVLFPDPGLLSQYGPLDELLYLENEDNQVNTPRPRGVEMPDTPARRFHESQIGERRKSYDGTTHEVVFAV